MLSSISVKDVYWNTAKIKMDNEQNHIRGNSMMDNEQL